MKKLRVFSDQAKRTYVHPRMKTLCLCDNNLMQDTMSIPDIDEDDDDTEEAAKPAIPHFSVWDEE